MVELRIHPPRYWRRIPQYYRLEAVRCKKCGRIYYPPRGVCDCGSGEFEVYRLPDRGTLVNYTVLYAVTSDFEKMKPLVIGIVDLGGVKVVGQIVDCLDPSRLKPGDEVEVVFRIVKVDGAYGLVTYGYKFRPLHTC